MSKITTEEVKRLTGITGDFQNETLQGWIEEVEAFLIDSGVKRENLTAGLIARGVMDLWNYGAGDGHFSEYFLQRATQLAYKN